MSIFSRFIQKPSICQVQVFNEKLCIEVFRGTTVWEVNGIFRFLILDLQLFIETHAQISVFIRLEFFLRKSATLQ